jgi:hypothetical protein
VLACRCGGQARNCWVRSRIGPFFVRRRTFGAIAVRGIAGAVAIRCINTCASLRHGTIDRAVLRRGTCDRWWTVRCHSRPRHRHGSHSCKHGIVPGATGSAYCRSGPLRHTRPRARARPPARPLCTRTRTLADFPPLAVHASHVHACGCVAAPVVQCLGNEPARRARVPRRRSLPARRARLSLPNRTRGRS